MPSPPDDRSVAEFWCWFASAARRLAATNFADQGLLQELDARVSRLGPLGWELGPGQQLSYSLTLTPDGSVELLPLTEAIVAAAAPIPDFELHSARPAKRWDLRFSITGPRGEEVPVDARAWRYVLFRFQDGLFDILIEEPNMGHAEEDMRVSAAIVVVDGLLGERERLLGIHTVDATVGLDPSVEAKASQIEHLADHWRRIRCGDHIGKPASR
ncbi:MAG: hypothetical protein JNL21_19910 [Myxococcales bacterium]|nr:hypothetical protein [Myxococcales bacterium]